MRQWDSMVIRENVFVYEKKFYKQIVGSTMGSAFTMTLANIFTWIWEQKLVRRQLATTEIYGLYVSLLFCRLVSIEIMSSTICRYIDDIFLTSNDSLETINEMLDEANNFHPNIKLVRQIG
jgi:hypothetical protein